MSAVKNECDLLLCYHSFQTANIEKPREKFRKSMHNDRFCGRKVECQFGFFLIAAETIKQKQKI